METDYTNSTFSNGGIVAIAVGGFTLLGILFAAAVIVYKDAKRRQLIT